jgi:rSAM/selenodomain-associated transferase 2/rSAM/selenodomain-associated transferase 1
MSATECFISIIIPVWRADDEALAELLDDLPGRERTEIIVAAPADEIGRRERLRATHPQIRWLHAARGRASQMNAAVAVANGEWLVFLHADCLLSARWWETIDRAAQDPRYVGGAYRFVLDSSDPRARLIELGVRWRVRLLGLPYGDQALFVRRDVFEVLGGYRDLPLMEDVDLVRRLKRAGTMLYDDLPVRTSARRWQRDGWARRSAQNAWLLALYFAGTSPAALARRYFRRHRVALAVMARAPWTAGKTRLANVLLPSDHRALRAALFHDTLAVVRRIADVDCFVLCEPPDACEEMRHTVGSELEVLAQHAGDLGDRMQGAFADLFRLGAEAAMLIGSDLPDLPARLLLAAREALEQGGDRVVLGPAADGGYYLIGLKALHAELFMGIDWGTGEVLQQTVERAHQCGLSVHLIEPWADVDDGHDLARLCASPPAEASLTRAWIATLGDRYSGIVETQ